MEQLERVHPRRTAQTWRPSHCLRADCDSRAEVLDQNERLATGDKEDGQDEGEQQGAAVQTICVPGQDEGVLEALENLVRNMRVAWCVSGPDARQCAK